MVIRDLLKDLWLLFGRMFPLPTTPGLREVGKPDRSSPVIVTCNFDLTVRKVIRTLKRDGVDAWLLVAPTRGINVWCAAGGGHFTTDRVVSVLKTSGISHRVDHRRLLLPQLAAAGVNIWSLQERTGWKPRFGPLRIDDLAGYLGRNRRLTEPAERRVTFGLKERLVMATNLASASLLFFIVPILVSSIWLGGFWWRSLLLLFSLAILNAVLVFRLPGRPGLQKGLSLGVAAGALFVALSQLLWDMSTASTVAWASWILFLSAYLGYDLPSWSPLWRADIRELLLGRRDTHIEIDKDSCTGCRLCDLVCPVHVFDRNPGGKSYFVANLDACQACGACVENCPANAITTNFSSGMCSCPTCTVINGVGALKPKQSPGDPSPDDLTPRWEGTCCGSGTAASPESTEAEPPPQGALGKARARCGGGS